MENKEYLMELTKTYSELVATLKSEIQHARIKAHLAVNKELILLYWNIGKRILETQEKEKWGAKVIENISVDLRKEFPEMKGLSSTNLKYMRMFADNFTLEEIGQQAADQIPWFHIVTLLEKIKDKNQRSWYIKKTIEHGWSRNVLTLQIKTNLYEREGRSTTNFKETLPAPQSDLAQQLIKDPYNLEFLDVQGDIAERHLEAKLIDNIRKFLLELGAGFSFVGNQYPMKLGEESYYLDLLFYHIKLKCYVVIELKTGKFKPEYAGKLNFYLNLVDKQLKDENDNPTIGLILCEEKQGITVEYAIEGIQKPMGVSQFKLTEELPSELKSYLPTSEDLSMVQKKSA